MTRPDLTRPHLTLTDARLRRAAGAGALIHVAAFVLATLLIGQPTVHEGQEAIEHSLVDTELGLAFTGMYVLTLGYLALLPVMLLLTSALGLTALGSWASRTAAAAGTATVVVVVGVGFSAGAAALWAQDQGLDLATVIALNNVRNFAYLVATPFMGLFALALGLAALADRALTRWVGWGGVAVGVLCLLAIPAAALGLPYAMPVWLLWWLGIGILLLRRMPVSVQQPRATRSPVEPAMGHD